MLSIFSCAYWPSVFLRWRNVYLGLLPFFNWVVWFFLLLYSKNSMNCLYILELSSCGLHHLQIFSPILSVVFSLCSWIPLQCKSLLSLNKSHLFIFVFISIALGDWPKKPLVQFMSENVLPMFSSRSFMVSCLLFKSKSFWVLCLCRAWGSVLISLTYIQLSNFLLCCFQYFLCLPTIWL